MSNSKPSKNAFSHGLYSDHVVLDCENKQEFVDLWQAFRDEYCPQQVSEEAAVLELASLHWKKRRLEAGLQQALNKRRAYSIDDANSDSWDSIGGEIRGVTRSSFKAARDVSDIIGKHVERASNPNETIADSKAMENEKLIVLAQDLNSFGKVLAPMFHAAKKLQLDQIERAYDPDIMERELKIQTEIDRRIDKVLKRLVMIKEIKKFYVAKDIESKPLVEIEALPAEPIGISEKIDPEG